MNRAVATLGLILVLTASSSADEKSEALAIVDSAIKAVGGEAKVAGLKNAVYKFKADVKEGGGNATVQGEVSARGMEQYRISLEISAGGQNQQMLLVLAGEQAWMSRMGNVEEAPKEILATIRQAFLTPRSATLLSLLKDKDVQLSPLGEVQVNNRPAVGLKVMRKDFKEFDLHFDKETHLLVKCETRGMGPNNQEAPFEYLCSEPKEFNGLKHFTKMLLRIDGKDLVEFELVELKTDQKLEDGLFGKP